MDKCIGCSYYDRQNGNNTDTRGVSWGQCRRTAPALHPVNQKSFMIEGVWPHVRDDDWCGEFKGSRAARRAARDRRRDGAEPARCRSAPAPRSAAGPPTSPRSRARRGERRIELPRFVASDRSDVAGDAADGLTRCPPTRVAQASTAGEHGSRQSRTPLDALASIPPRRSPRASPSSPRTIVSRAP